MVPFVGYAEEPAILIFKYIPVCFVDVLKDKSFISLQNLVRIAKDIALGMRDIHVNNIIHFDLKPGKNTKKDFILQEMF